MNRKIVSQREVNNTIAKQVKQGLSRVEFSDLIFKSICFMDTPINLWFNSCIFENCRFEDCKNNVIFERCESVGNCIFLNCASKFSMHSSNFKYCNFDNCDYDVNIINSNLKELDIKNCDIIGNIEDSGIASSGIHNSIIDNVLFMRSVFLTNDVVDSKLSNNQLRFSSIKNSNIYDNVKLENNECRECDYTDLQCPEKGSFIGYKVCRNYIVELLITEDAKRSSATSRKCRCSKAKVLSITSIDGSSNLNSVASSRDKDFVYKVGETVVVDDFDENRWKECSTGIHFFMTRNEAVQYATW